MSATATPATNCRVSSGPRASVACDAVHSCGGGFDGEESCHDGDVEGPKRTVLLSTHVRSDSVPIEYGYSRTVLNSAASFASACDVYAHRAYQGAE